jgi:hypothetical protein
MSSQGGMTVGVRLALGFALVIAMLVASMAMSINRLQSLGSSVEEFAQSRVPCCSVIQTRDACCKAPARCATS